MARALHVVNGQINELRCKLDELEAKFQDVVAPAPSSSSSVTEEVVTAKLGELKDEIVKMCVINAKSIHASVDAKLDSVQSDILSLVPAPPTIVVTEEFVATKIDELKGDIMRTLRADIEAMKSDILASVKSCTCTSTDSA